jgi:regulator of protease activity HflC (stomatin/prohibitin superfamily)
MNLTKARSFFMIDNTLQLLPVTADELTEGTPNPQFIIALNKRLNAQAGRITAMLQEIEETNPNKIGYADIMHWKSRATYLRNVGKAKAAAALEKAQALKEAKDADHDEEFMEGYQTFLTNEFNAQA